MGNVLDFTKEGLKSIHFFTKHVEETIAVATYNDEQEFLVETLSEILHMEEYTTFDLARWCDEHKLQYVILPNENANNGIGM